MCSFPCLEPAYCSMSSSNCCSLTYIQISQEAGKVVWYSHLFQNFPQFIVIHIVKGFGMVNKAEIDVFLELSCFFDDPEDVGNVIFGSSAFSKTSLNIWKFMVHVLLKPGLENFGFQPWPLFFPQFLSFLFFMLLFLVPALPLFCNILPIPLVFVFLSILTPHFLFPLSLHLFLLFG